MLRIIKAAKLRSFQTEAKYMNGFRIPTTYKQAMALDEKNENHKWEEAIKLEIDQLMKFKCFKDLGKHDKKNPKVPRGYRKITGHLIFAVKHDGRFKARYVAGGHLTDTPIENVYSGVVSLKGLKTIIFLGELNGMEAWGTDISNAYLNAETSEKVAIVGGGEFKRFGLDGHLLLIDKALYGLKSSGKRFNELLGECLRLIGFQRTGCEDDVWYKKCPTAEVYKYVGTYVNDLCIVMKDPESFIAILEGPEYKFTLKGTGPLSFYLGCGFEG